MSDSRTHDRGSAVDDDDTPPPHRVLTGPAFAEQAGARVTLTFENARYAEIFLRIHRIEPMNALKPGWDAYYRGAAPSAQIYDSEVHKDRTGRGGSEVA